MIPILILTPLILLAGLGAVWMARPVHAALLLEPPENSIEPFGR